MNRILRYKGPCAGVNEWLQPKRNGGMMLTPEYRAFKETMQLMYQVQWGGDPPIKHKIDVVLYIRFPGTDHDALNKPIFDAMQAAGVIADDNLVDSYVIIPELPQMPAHQCMVRAILLEAGSIGPWIQDGLEKRRHGNPQKS